MNRRYSVNWNPSVNRRYSVNSNPPVNRRYSVNSNPSVNRRYSISLNPSVNRRYSANSNPSVNRRYSVNSNDDAKLSHNQINSKDQATLEIFYVKKSNNMIGWENLGGLNSRARPLNCLQWMNQSVVSVDVYPCAKNQHHSSIHSWHIIEPMLGKCIWMDWIN